MEERFPSLAPETTRERQVAEALERAADRAQTIGEVKDHFRAEAALLLNQHDVLAERRLRLLEDAAEGNEHLRLEDQPENVGGMNVIGGGEATILINRASFTDMGSQADVDRVRLTAEHERVHGETHHLHGSLTLDDEQRSDQELHTLLYEGYAEICANEAVGEDAGRHREGQPEKIYGEGQDFILDIIAQTSRMQVDSVMKGDGDLSRLELSQAA
jgi:hypothetical protein